MLNIDVLSDYNSRFEDPNYPFLKSQYEDFKHAKPLQGLRIVHNLINSFETLLKLEALVHAGADLTVTRCHFASFPYQAEVDAVIERAGLRHIPDHRQIEGEFDLGLDCAGDLLRLPKIKITRGVVELTRVGAIAYAKAQTPYPVISVDDSKLKNLECMYGTGESFVRAFMQLTGKSLNNRHFVVFGFGKVGKGIVKNLSAYTDKITVVEAHEGAVAQAKSRGFVAVDIADTDALRATVSDAFALVTATGVDRMLSKYLRAADVSNAYIANMGVDDEIGNAFETRRVLFGGAPINFSLKHPTLMRYFDPICYAHNLAAELLVTRSFEPGFHAYPHAEDNAIVSKWAHTYNEDVSDLDYSR